MVGDDYVDSQTLGMHDFLLAQTAAVDRDDQIGACIGDFLHRLDCHPVAFDKSVRDKRRYVLKSK